MDQPKTDAASTAWRIIKVAVYIVRFWFGFICILAFIGAMLDLISELSRGFNGARLSQSFGFEIPGEAWHALILLIAAFVIWPQRYNPILQWSAQLLHRKSPRRP